MAENTLRYISLDHAVHRDLLLARVRSRWSLSWNDFLAGSFGRVIVDLVAWSTSTLAFVVNRAAAENFIPTMTLRESAVRLGALVGYKLRGPAAATVYCDAVLPSAATGAVRLAKGATIAVQLNGLTVIYELAEDYTIAEGATEPERITLVVDPYAAGPLVLNTQFVGTPGASYVDLVDPTIDLDQFVERGQKLQKLVNSTPIGPSYVISDIVAAPTTLYASRLILETPLNETGTDPVLFSAQIVDRRVLFVQGQSFVDVFAVPVIETPNLLLRLTRSPVISGTVTVTVNQTPWSVVQTLATQDQSALAVELKTLTDGRTAILFGDNSFGAIPASGAQIRVSYRVGGGTSGNADPGTIHGTIIGQLANSQISVLVTNTSSPGQGGADPETLAEARNNIPAYVQTNDRAVTAKDYESLATSFNDPLYGQVRYARALANTRNSFLEGNTVTVYAWTTGPSGGLIPLSAGLKGALTTYLQSKAVGTDYVFVQDGSTRPAPIAVRFKAFTGYNIPDVTATVKTRIDQLVAAVKPGDSIVFSDLVSTLDVLEGVDSITVATPLKDLNPSNTYEIFTPPDDSYGYGVNLKTISSHTYEDQLPFATLAAWAFQVYVGERRLLVIPETDGQRARLVGSSTVDGLSSYDVGLKKNLPVLAATDTWRVGDFYYAADEDQLYLAELQQISGTATVTWQPVSDGGSYVELTTGRIVISFKGAPRPVVVKLTTVQGYDTARTINVYASYTGAVDFAKRQEIRRQLRAWADGLQIGAAVYAVPISSNGQILVAASRANVRDAILCVPGVTNVTRVTLDSPNNASQLISVADYELVQLGSITLNGLVD